MIKLPLSLGRNAKGKNFTLTVHLNFFPGKAKEFHALIQWFSNFKCASESPGGLTKYRLLGSIPEFPIQQFWGLHFRTITLVANAYKSIFKVVSINNSTQYSLRNRQCDMKLHALFKVNYNVRFRLGFDKNINT